MFDAWQFSEQLFMPNLSFVYFCRNYNQVLHLIMYIHALCVLMYS